MNDNQWKKEKKKLPKEWCKMVSESLISKGFNITSRQVTDIRCGKIKDLVQQEAVWKEIKELKKKHKAKVNQISRLKK